MPVDDDVVLTIDNISTILGIHSDRFYVKYSLVKNRRLRAEREITFSDVINCVETGRVVDIIRHHNAERYPNQYIMIININDYAYEVPFSVEHDTLILHTVWPSRRATKQFMRCVKEQGEYYAI